jgi:hypothetical protein
VEDLVTFFYGVLVEEAPKYVHFMKLAISKWKKGIH